jgi:Zn-dependent M28 family amino/carboxypeptidase
MRHVEVIGSEPHPAGSPAMAKVAVYLQSRLRQLGLEVEVEVEVEPMVMRDATTSVTLRVVVGRLPGRAPTGAVAFIAHPDSVAAGPGAGDNATGVATLLETARALSTRPPRNDVLFVFDDGEEMGDYPGGHLFADNHPWAKDVKLAVGLDTAAWGVPSLMQDSNDNGQLIPAYAGGVAHPIAFGLDASTNRDDPAEIGVFRSRGIPAIELEDTYANVNHTRRATPWTA